MDAQQWAEACRADAVVHDWAEIAIHSRGSELRLRVSADAAKIRTPGDYDVRRSGGARACDVVAQLLGGHMLTPKLVDDRHRAASVILRPLPAPLIRPGGTVANVSDFEHSAAIDRAIMRAEAFKGWGASPYQGRGPYDEHGELVPWLVSSVGKHFVLHARVTERTGINYGWPVHRSECVNLTWLGTPTSPAVTGGDFRVLQSPGGAHGLDQDDYSQLIVIADGTCTIDGHECPTAKVYTDPSLSHFVVADGSPLKSARHPGVRAPSIGSEPPETIPEWRNPTLDPRERQLLWSLSLEGYAEQPLGSNTAPLIEVWDSRTERDGVPGFGAWLAKTANHWCASFASSAAIETELDGDPPMPHRTRASGYELENDAKASGAWHPVADVVAGKWSPRPGDIVILPRTGAAPGSWERHVARVVSVDGDDLETIDGNSANKVQRVQRKIGDPIGYIEIPDRDADADAELVEGIDAAKWQPPGRMNYTTIAKRFSFGIFRACYGVTRDATLLRHFDKARAAGMTVGAYMFFVQGEPWKKQLEVFADQLTWAGLTRGDIVPALDIEPTPGVAFDDDVVGDGCRRIADELVDSYGDCLIYTNASTIAKLGDPAWIRERPLWLASKTSRRHPTGPTTWAIWQYDAVPIDGSDGVPVDVNRARRVPVIT